ncbi:type II toxin-antitoxin system VapC family toxin [Oscillatoria acuminata]|uniref:Putative nucleic acid-binding protein, contains PIN domain n=2 Tax=Oscillatoriales TaxID=1150 RepID=K9TM80_9CYAN|nr:type II toxin-antitoxin system VapC family toxin [Oscillatoria acuminata]AFY83645.1 putative nucleic acid-binding protein, contains PIN domain [Oscillatoria acuminata PCC 6304]
MSRTLCLDTNVLIKYLVAGESHPDAIALMEEVIEGRARLVAPSFTWAEVGSVLRKKIRVGLLTTEQATDLFSAFCDLPIEYINGEELYARAWAIAHQYHLPTLYDAAFLACSEKASAEFWTADKTLLNSLGTGKPDYVKELGE